MVSHRKEDRFAFEMRLEADYARPVVNFDYQDSNRAGGVVYEQSVDAHSLFINFLSISNVLENAARKYDADWSIDKVRKESEAQESMIDPTVAHYDGAYADLIYQVGTLTSTAIVAIKLIKAIQPSLVQWLQNRGTSMLKVKIGTSEISVQGKRDIDEILRVLKNVASDKVQERQLTSKERKNRARNATGKTPSPKAKVRPLR